MQLNLKENESKICRTCLQRIDGNSKCFELDATDPNIDPITIRHKLTVYIPEMDLMVIPTGVICNDCHVTIDSAYQFKQHCLQIEEDIRKYLHKTNGVVSVEKLLRARSTKERAYMHVDKISEPVQVQVQEEPVRVPIKEEPVEYMYANEYETSIPEYVVVKPELPEPKSTSLEHKNSFINTHSSDNKNETMANLRVKLQLKKEMRFKCELCGFTTAHNSSFAAHMKYHSKQIFSNIVCNNEGALKYKIKTSTNRILYKCGMCSYTSYKKTLLRFHIRKIHKPEKPFRCSKCMYSSISSSSLEKHMKAHIIKCDICNYSSMQMSSIKAHMRTHTGEKPYKCPKCDYRASQKGTLNGHMQTHNNECHLCGFRTSTEIRLLDHMVWHAIKPNAQYKCGRKNTSYNDKLHTEDETNYANIYDDNLNRKSLDTNVNDEKAFSNIGALTIEKITIKQQLGASITSASTEKNHPEKDILSRVNILNRKSEFTVFPVTK